ncbi:high affinity immunoglobulin alpha and immunoglobulin mu Fc receptor [Oryctolagus cuniculus]|uniref:high affinity immunoglobulin alpha and immunoglobulin mu Fc receptor n=1 Tax=Oryctolagus cuniculus TaxID=9986 RepID=UPI00387A5305
MDGEAPPKSREPKVANRRAGWKKPLLLILYLLQGSSLAPAPRGSHLRSPLQVSSFRTHLCAMETLTPSSTLCWQEAHSFTAAHSLKGPKLVSGKPGGAVTIQCHYPPVSVNKHQRKYWCRLGPPRWICYTIVSSYHYTHRLYGGRVALADFPQRGVFVVTLSRLSLDDVGSYRCGIGDRNNMLFSSMNLTLSAGGPSTAPTATAAAGELSTASRGTASMAAHRWTPGTTPAVEVQGTEWETVAPTPGSSKTTPPAKGRQTPGTARTEAPGTGSQGAGPTEATAASPESPASTIRSMPNATDGAWGWGPRSSVTMRAEISKDGGVMTTTEAAKPTAETERVRVDLNTTGEVTGATRPSAVVSGSLAWETLQEATSPVSKQQALDATEGTSPATGMWTLGATSVEAATVGGGTDGDLDIASGDSGPQAMPSEAPAAGPGRLPGKGSSVKSALPEEASSSRILTLVSTTLAVLLLVALALLQRKLRRRRRRKRWRRRTSQKAERAPEITLVQMTHVLELHQDPPCLEGKMLHGDSRAAQPRPIVPERDPEP